jgi:hypothetical protein
MAKNRHQVGKKNTYYLRSKSRSGENKISAVSSMLLIRSKILWHVYLSRKLRQISLEQGRPLQRHHQVGGAAVAARLIRTLGTNYTGWEARSVLDPNGSGP